MKRATTSIVTFSLTSLSVICIATGQTNTPTPAPTVSSVPAAPTMSTPAAPLPIVRQSGGPMPQTNPMDNFRRNQERMQRMNAMRQMGRPPQLDAVAKAAAAAKMSQGAAVTSAAKPITDETATKQAADTKKPATETAASPTASATAAAASPKN